MSASKIGRFEILNEVAHSEHSSVYRATDTATNRPVALKAFNLDLAGDDRPQLVKRLIQEAESTRNLSHQNIVLLYGAGEIDGRFCVATECVEGFSIAATIAKGERYTVWDMLDISRQVCNGLDHAHSHGVVHRRMHPANVLIQWDGTVKILGFGIAGMWTEEDSPGILSSASYYASPEQVRGQSLHTRSNIFSWGAILYEMATGKKPFDGADVDAVRQQILDVIPVSPLELNPKITPNLAALILKAMSKAPTDRFATGRELLGELESCKEAPKMAGLGNSSAAAAPKPSAPAVAPPMPQASSPFAHKLEAAEYSDDDQESDLLMSAGGQPARGKAAAAGAGGGSRPEIRASVAAVKPETVAPVRPKMNFDPLMGSGEGAGTAGASFTNSELPPLKSPPPDQFSPPPPLEPVPTEAEKPSDATLFSTFSPAEAKKFELPKIESKLLIHGLIGGLVVIVVVVALIALYVRVHTSDDEGLVAPAAASKAVATSPESAPAPVASQAQPSAPAAAPEEQPAATAPVTRSPVTRSSGRRTARETPTPSRAPGAAVAGMLTVDSSPQGAQIEIDGRTDSSWVTPATVPGLAPGQHNVTISKSGYTAENRALSVSSGSKNTLSVHLNVLAAMISVGSDPSGASIFIDGRDSGKVTPSQISLEKGSHSVLVRRGGYLDETMTADVQPGQTIGFAPHLRQLGSTDEIRSVNKLKKMFGGKDSQAGMGQVAIHTTPKGAQISVNQRVLDHLSPAEFLLNPGNYVVEITASGYKSLRRVITVEKNGKLTIDEVLERE